MGGRASVPGSNIARDVTLDNACGRIAPIKRPSHTHAESDASIEHPCSMTVPRARTHPVVQTGAGGRSRHTCSLVVSARLASRNGSRSSCDGPQPTLTCSKPGIGHSASTARPSCYVLNHPSTTSSESYVLPSSPSASRPHQPKYTPREQCFGKSEPSVASEPSSSHSSAKHGGVVGHFGERLGTSCQILTRCPRTSWLSGPVLTEAAFIACWPPGVREARVARCGPSIGLQLPWSG
jgi:hypothetical protein